MKKSSYTQNKIKKKLIFSLILILIITYYLFNLNEEFFLVKISFIIGLIGIMFNFLAISSNDWKMPVYINKVDEFFDDYEWKEKKDEKHFYFKNKNDVNFFIFSDIIRFDFVGAFIISIGDIFIFSSMILLIIGELIKLVGINFSNLF